MNLNLKAVYYCATSGHKWGKGLTIQDAKKAAGLRSKAAEKGVEFYVQAAIFNNPTDDELENMLACVTAGQILGSPKYYDHGRTEEDTEMINRLHVGWLMVEPIKKN